MPHVCPCAGIRELKLATGETANITHTNAGGGEQFCNWAVSCTNNASVPSISVRGLDLKDHFEYLWAFQVADLAKMLSSVNLGEMNQFFVMKHPQWVSLSSAASPRLITRNSGHLTPDEPPIEVYADAAGESLLMRLSVTSRIRKAVFSATATCEAPNAAAAAACKARFVPAKRPTHYNMYILLHIKLNA